MTVRNNKLRIARQITQKVDPNITTSLTQETQMTIRTDHVENHPGDAQARLEMKITVQKRRNAIGHRTGIDDQHDRYIKQQGYLGHKQYGSTYQYHALISEQDYAKNNIFRLVDEYIKDSYKGIVSTFLKEEKLSVAELRDLISQIEEYKKTKK